MSFDDFWTPLAWKRDKGNAEKAYKTAKDWPGDAEAAQVYNTQLEKNGQFQKRPPAWIRAQGWLDEDRPVPSTVGRYTDANYKPLPYAPKMADLSDALRDITQGWLVYLVENWGHPDACPMLLAGTVRASAAYHPLNGWMLVLCNRFDRKIRRAAFAQCAHADGRMSADDVKAAKRDLLVTMDEVETAKEIAAKIPEGNIGSAISKEEVRV